jgi:hypothetical protein
MLKYLRAREARIKLLYTLNMFRAVQKRLTLELREMGTRDRVMADCIYLSPQEVEAPVDEQPKPSSTSRRNGAPSEAFNESTYSSLYKVDVTGSPLKKSET